MLPHPPCTPLQHGGRRQGGGPGRGFACRQGPVPYSMEAYLMVGEQQLLHLPYIGMAPPSLPAPVGCSELDNPRRFCAL
jgi:hypothetical protein